LLRTTRIQVLLARDHADTPDPTASQARVVVLDTDTRHAPPTDAAHLVTRYVAQALGASRTTRVVKKVDSLLRGNLATEVAALVALLDATAVIATALPSARRSVVAGVPTVDGVALADTTLWAAEGRPTPETVADVLTGLDHVLVPLDVVRDPARLRQALAAAELRSAAVVCDAETDADLDAVVVAAEVLRNPLLVGSAALVAADARQLSPDEVRDPVAAGPRDQVLVAVVGSAAPGVAEQVRQLEQLDLPVLTLNPQRLLDSPADAADRVERHQTPRGLVLTLDQAGAVDPAAARRLTAALAVAAAPATTRATVLLATGGETARAVLDSLAVHALTPLSTHAAAVTSRTAEGLVVITRPGSHGASASSLRDALAPFAAAAQPDPSTTDLH
jgi:4-hydroxythreonine-4-phosphate dehydrogenase